jgi:hypothetical protein
MTSLRQRLIEDMQIRNLAVNTQESYNAAARSLGRRRRNTRESGGRSRISDDLAQGGRSREHSLLLLDSSCAHSPFVRI